MICKNGCRCCDLIHEVIIYERTDFELTGTA